MFIEEPRYHLGPRNSRHLVYTDFGADLVAQLGEAGMETAVHRLTQDEADDRGRVVTFASTKT